MSQSPGTKKCKYCQTDIDVKAKICPNCHKKQGGKAKVILAIAALAIIISIASQISGQGNNKSTPASKDTTSNESTTKEANTATDASTNTDANTANDASTNTDVNTSTNENTTNDTKTNDTSANDSKNLTMGQKNALKKADAYFSMMAFSHDGIISQLEFDGFSNEEAVYAADNCGMDWNEQAAKKAKSYLDISSFSRSGLIDQLQFDGFTAEQANYGADANGF